jgi:hypothetical protein
VEGPWHRAEGVAIRVEPKCWSWWPQHRRSQRPNLGVAKQLAVGVEDLQLDATAGRPESVLCHRYRRHLPDHVASAPDPGAPLELEAEAGGLGERHVDRPGEARRLEDDETRADPARVRRQPADDRLVAPGEARRQVDHEQVDRSTGEESPREREPLARIGRAQDDQPAQVDAAADRFEGVERVSEIQKRDDRSGGLCFCHATEGERGLATRGVSADRRVRGARQAPRTKHLVEGGEAGGDDVVRLRRERVRRLRRRWVEGGRERSFDCRSGRYGSEPGVGRAGHV